MYALLTIPYVPDAFWQPTLLDVVLHHATTLLVGGPQPVAVFVGADLYLIEAFLPCPPCVFLTPMLRPELRNSFGLVCPVHLSTTTSMQVATATVSFSKSHMQWACLLHTTPASLALTCNRVVTDVLDTAPCRHSRPAPRTPLPPVHTHPHHFCVATTIPSSIHAASTPPVMCLRLRHHTAAVSLCRPILIPSHIRLAATPSPRAPHQRACPVPRPSAPALPRCHICPVPLTCPVSL
ncbi:hypothetical protein DFH08DRAFT_977179 [Mycena albidolilacea]|uniref:Uncharacterized protein n=1 Tax=Mycena albidolilacea TaxID=1033008 RepID=A0AAD6Z1A9_9AGAR|nr:hypothetical protein DFH08DRAFT_977179 [Mycena albidolilacea]